MISRKYSQLANDEMKNLLESRWDNVVLGEQFQSAMYTMGQYFGEQCSSKVANSSAVCVVCTVEDADYLARGVVDYFTANRSDVSVAFACFWNHKTIDAYGYEELDLAPAFKKYVEPVGQDCTLIIVKAVISGGCVVATNITNMIDNLNPKQILVVAPIMLDTSPESLEKHFSQAVVEKFDYLNLAVDTGWPKGHPSVYERYGWKDEHDKNRSTPKVVKERRKQFATV